MCNRPRARRLAALLTAVACAAGAWVWVTPVLHAQSAPAGRRTVFPVCVGECARVVGLRLTFRERAADRIVGVNTTLWKPYGDAPGLTTGLALGLPIAGMGSVDGLLSAPLFAQADSRLRGIGAGGVGVSADVSTGMLGGGLLALSGTSRGAVVSGGASIATVRAGGLVLGGLGTYVGSGWGIAAGGAATLTTGSYTGIVLGGLTAQSSEVRGAILSAGYARANAVRGVSVALVNYAKSLRGAQLGVLNIVADGRAPRWLPVINWR